jgi:hypothetical protein
MLLLDRIKTMASIILMSGEELSKTLAEWSLVALTGLLAIVTYILYKGRDDVSEYERFENQFFEMIKMYRDNVQEMQYTNPSFEKSISKIKNGATKTEETLIEKKKEIENGRMVFVNINREFLHLYKDLIKLIHEPDDGHKADVISIAWLTIFFGLSNEGRVMLENNFKQHKYDVNYWSITSYILTKLDGEYTDYNDNVKKYGGHQIRLGHYFRHLYQTVLFVHKHTFIKDKKKYVRMLRGQFSTFEQAIIFYNSLSPLGNKWEFSIRDINYSLRGEKYQLSDCLITEYELIKNIPMNFCEPINPEYYFNRIRWEYKKYKFIKPCCKVEPKPKYDM